MRWITVITATLLLSCSALRAAQTAPSTRPATLPTQLPHIDVDVKNRRIRLECEAVNAPYPLEFLVCMAGTAEHEAVLRSRAKGSHLHLALLMLGLEPGQHAVYSPEPDKRTPPRGPALAISAEFQKEGRSITVPATRLMRDRRTHREMPATTWVFAGSRLTEDGTYAADVTGQLVSVVNFEFTVIDVPELRSSSNETLEWEVNPDVSPKRETKVWLIIEPADKNR